MATATKIQLVEFNYVLNFQLNDIGSVTEKYSGQVQKNVLFQ